MDGGVEQTSIIFAFGFAKVQMLIYLQLWSLVQTYGVHLLGHGPIGQKQIGFVLRVKGLALSHLLEIVLNRLCLPPRAEDGSSEISEALELPVV